MSPMSAGRRLLRALAAALLASLGAGALDAQITRLELEVVERPALGGRAIPGVGEYERLRGIAYGELDPTDRRNALIVDLDRAPRNERGRVEYRTVVEIYRAIDLKRWNGAIYHTVPNRGRAVEPDEALLARGFAFAQVGWQGDIRPTDSNIVALLPVATEPDGSPLIAPALEEFIFDDADTLSTGRLSYPAASLNRSRALLTVRQNQADPREPLPARAWRFVNDREIEIRRPSGFDGGAIYELVYDARDPIVMGIGFAATRDVIAFLRHEPADDEGTPNPLWTGAPAGAALSIGVSQSGRYLRDMLYLGFNEDLEGRIVFDGMHPDIAGSRKTFTNYRFSQPGRWQKQHEDHVYPGDQFPFTYAVLTDPVSGRTDGVMARCLETGTCPKIVHTDGEAEIWQARASLIVTDTRGADLELPDNVRAYLLAGTQHGGGPGVDGRTPGGGICRNPTNPLPISEVRRALTVALYEWVSMGTPPPPSRFPRAATGGLVEPDAVRFPAIPGVSYTGSVNGLTVMSHDRLPPAAGAEYPVLVGQVDEDGNMVEGVLHPHLDAPIGTHTGWNLRREGFAAGEQCAGAGSFLRFAETEAERRRSGDPRLSFAERYGSRQGYVEQVREAADRLVAERLLLPEDAEAIVEQAARGQATN